MKHVLGDAVEHRPHAHDRAGRLDVGAEDGRAVRLGEDRVGDLAPDLAPVDVPRRDDMDVAGAVASDLGMQQPGEVVRAPTVMGDALHERTRAIADADERDVDRTRCGGEHQAALRSPARRSSRSKFGVGVADAAAAGSIGANGIGNTGRALLAGA